VRKHQRKGGSGCVLSGKKVDHPSPEGTKEKGGVLGNVSAQKEFNHLRERSKVARIPTSRAYAFPSAAVATLGLPLGRDAAERSRWDYVQSPKGWGGERKRRVGEAE